MGNSRFPEGNTKPACCRHPFHIWKNRKEAWWSNWVCLQVKIAQRPSIQLVDVSAPKPDELKSFLQKVSRCNSRPGILSLVPEFQGRYIPKLSLPSFQRSLQDVYNLALMKASYPDFKTIIEPVCIELSEEMVDNVEEATRVQSNSRLWYQYRAGRVKASKNNRSVERFWQCPLSI